MKIDSESQSGFDESAQITSFFCDFFVPFEPIIEKILLILHRFQYTFNEQRTRQNYNDE